MSSCRRRCDDRGPRPPWSLARDLYRTAGRRRETLPSMRSYREYCPIARASEIVAERWTPLVVRNLLYGCHTFTEIARGVPAMSRSLLIKRLKELQRSGVIIKTAD